MILLPRTRGGPSRAAVVTTILALAILGVLSPDCAPSRGAADSSPPPPKADAAPGTAAAPRNPGTQAMPSDPYAGLPRHRLRPQDLPRPYATPSATNPPRVVARPNGAVLRAPAGFEVLEAASGFDMPRQMAQAPNGDVFLSESNANRVTVLRDADGDGRFEKRWVWAGDLDLPFGLAFVGNYLYVANTGSVVRFPYRPGDTSASSGPEVVVPKLPGQGYRQHWTRNLAYDARAGKMFVSVGSASNLDEDEPHRAAILTFSIGPAGPASVIPRGGAPVEDFATGLRNPVGLALEPVTGVLWTCVNERDGLGDDLVPDYATSVRKGGFYGWPYAYIGPHPQPGFAQKRTDLVKRTIVPDVLFEAHSAALGMAFYSRTEFPEHFRGGAFVAHHGSWNRSRRVGYKVVYLPFREGKALGSYEDFLTGFGDDPDSPEVWGRPVGILVYRDGSLLVSDDGGDKLWRIRYKGTR